jgi:hypothetical protein
VLLDRTPLGKAEAYAQFKIHSGDHISVWGQFQRNGIAPPEMEYEEAPRGRVMYNKKTRRFTLLADKCILNNRRILSKIMSTMDLPIERTDKVRDNHYQCHGCLYGGREEP